MIKILSYGFMQKALISGILIALCSSLLGVFLVLKRYAMIGDGLAHVSFASVALALFLNQQPLILSLPLVMLASFFIMRLNEKTALYGDAAIGLVSSFAMAVGVMLASVATGFNVDLFSYLFGSILVIRTQELILTLVLAVVILGVIFFYYKDLFAITYDEEFSKTLHLPVERLNQLISVLTAITIVLGIRIVGTMLISAMIIFPAITALQFARSFRCALTGAALISLLCVITGVFASYFLDLPTGSTIVIINGIFFAVTFGLKKVLPH